MKPHILASLPPSIDYSDFLEELTTAHRALTELDTLLKQTPNPRIFERSFMTKEAVLSSRIEGTIASVDEVLCFDAGAVMATESLHDDAIEITNYRNALKRGIDLLDEKPLGENTIRELHQILLSKGRGANRSPGDFRKSQVYIGRVGQSIDDASYVPPEAQNIQSFIQNLLSYIHELDERDDLVRIAIVHYQFEAIHPFLDGNGRVGRLLISLLLHEKKLLQYPYLYLSEYFEEHRTE
jgi:Fic family protein